MIDIFSGFRSLTQAQLLNDQLFYGDSLDVQPWLIYFISKPIHGVYQAIRPFPAITPDDVETRHLGSPEPPIKPPNRPVKIKPPDVKNIKSFNDVLGQFPLIARQMQSGLERIFRDVRNGMQDELRHASPQDHSADSISNGSSSLAISNGDKAHVTIEGVPSEEKEDCLRRLLETAVTAAVDLFQQVDKQQLSLLGATTSLTGPDVERLIERYITEQLHDSVLFPFLCAKEKHADLELESRISGMQNVDLAQLGIAMEGGKSVKAQLTQRIAIAVEVFRKLGISGSPQQMMEILLNTQRSITTGATGEADKELKTFPLTTSADSLVSLLLLVVIRSQVRHLNARLSYMRSFMFIDDVEVGEMGYALSTFEAVLIYLATDSGGLRQASRRNRKLWQAIQGGQIEDIRSILEPANAYTEEPEEPMPASRPNGHTDGYSLDTSTLAHVFPFQSPPSPPRVKRVSMDMRSLSSSSEYSFLSRTTTLDSKISAIEGDISIATLSQTQDENGNSLLMMAVVAKQPQSLEYLLSLEDLFALSDIFEDADKDGTTLLSAAVQSSDMRLVEPILQSIAESRDLAVVSNYFKREDNRGRTVAHYLFNLPALISAFHNMIPWTLKDKNGQTPLFALCRSYDHPHYSSMVEQAISFATQQQGDGEALHLDEHVDLKRNTLLHVVNDPLIAAKILRHCDSDPNATNDKLFTPLMMASKYGRIDMVKTFFADPRVDLNAREHRGMSAVELAKDDGVRNRMDEMVMLSHVPTPDGRVTAIVRSFFVDDASVRMIIKSALSKGQGTIDVTTCRRSLTDFENLARWLSMEHPASWLPSIFNFRSAFQIPSRPSRAILQDMQFRLEGFLKIMLAHSTFKEHELLWEFYLFPEIQLEMMAERSRRKADARAENTRDELEPITDVREVLSFVEHARDSIRAVSHCIKSVTRRLTGVRVGFSNVAAASTFCADGFTSLSFLPACYITAFQQYAACVHPYASDPHKAFHYELQSILSTILAILTSLARPNTLVSTLSNIQKAIDRHEASTRRTDRWPLALLEETRRGIHAEAQEKAEQSRRELHTVGCELRYTQQTVANELAGWQDLHAQLGRRAIRTFAERMVVREQDRLDNMYRAIRRIAPAEQRGRTRQRV